MKMKKQIKEMVTVKQGVAAAIKETVTNQGFYRFEIVEQVEMLDQLAKKLSEIYGLREVKVIISNASSHGCYNREFNEIQMNRVSMITFLHCFRIFMIEEGKVTEKTDKTHIQAWACKAFSLACPNSFEKSVKLGNVLGVTWDDEMNAAVIDVEDETEDENLLVH